MKKLLMLTAAGLIFQVTPVLAGHHEGDKGGKFEKHDTNGDGMISEAEFLEHAKKRFAEKDTNGDGSISKEEAKAGRDASRDKMKEKWKAKKEKRELDKRRSEIEGE